MGDTSKYKELEISVKVMPGQPIDQEPEPKKKVRPKEPDEKVLKEFFKQTEGVPWPSRFTTRSKHYEVNCNVSKDAANTYSKVLEALFKKYSKITSSFGWSPALYCHSFQFSYNLIYCRLSGGSAAGDTDMVVSLKPG